MRSTRSALSVATVALAVSLVGCATDERPTDAGTARSDPTDSETSSTSPPAAVETDPPAAAGTAAGYRDGEYSATGWYGGLPSHQDVTLTIDDGTVTAVQINTPADNATSLGYQERFAAALPEAIIGRDIDELDVDRLAGSSGCSQGFMDALAQIKAEAAV